MTGAFWLRIHRLSPCSASLRKTYPNSRSMPSCQSVKFRTSNGGVYLSLGEKSSEANARSGVWMATYEWRNSASNRILSLVDTCPDSMTSLADKSASRSTKPRQISLIVERMRHSEASLPNVVTQARIKRIVCSPSSNDGVRGSGVGQCATVDRRRDRSNQQEVMSDLIVNLNQARGNTPLTPDELAGLRPGLTTKGELDQFERTNILDANR